MAYQKIYLPDTPVQLVATTATKYTIVSAEIHAGAVVYNVVNPSNVASQVAAVLLEVNVGPVPTDDFTG
jgi:hypothetical protein